MKQTFTLLLFISLFKFSNGQFSYNNRNDYNGTDKRNTISLTIGGAYPGIGISYERFIGKIGLECGLSVLPIPYYVLIVVPFAGAGIKFYPNSVEEKTINWYIGYNVSFILPLPVPINYFSIGIDHVAENGFRLSVDVGLLMIVDYGTVMNFPMCNAKIGKAF